MVMEILNRSFLKRCRVVIILFITYSAFVTSCEKEANVKIPESEPKPVLVCFISPEDSLITVKLTNSIPLYTESSKKYPYEIKNATLTISNGISSKIIPWYKDSIGYQLSTSIFPIKGGETYTLEVTIPDGRNLKANTKVPSQDFPSFNFTIEKNLIDSNEFAVNYEFIYQLSWNDLPGAGNFYRGIIYNLYSDSILGADTISQIFNEVFESDEGKDGGSIKIAGQGNIFYFPGSSAPLSSSNYIAYLMLCNKEYYDYHLDLYINNDINPFSEPKINFSNIEGGIGCFSAYRLAKKRF
jgi:hypothetical protein